MIIMNNDNLVGTTWLVTGATSGIGKALAARLAVAGARVLAHARDPERGAALVAELRAQSAEADVQPVCADLSRRASVRQLAEAVAAERVDVLVNNAGAVHFRRQATSDGLEATFATNHLAPFLLTRQVLVRRQSPLK